MLHKHRITNSTVQLGRTSTHAAALSPYSSDVGPYVWLGRLSFVRGKPCKWDWQKRASVIDMHRYKQECHWLMMQTLSLWPFCVTFDSRPLEGLNLLPFDSRDLRHERSEIEGWPQLRPHWPLSDQTVARGLTIQTLEGCDPGPATRSVDNTINRSIQA